MGGRSGWGASTGQRRGAMVSTKNMVVSLVSGAFFAIGWWVLISGIIESHNCAGCEPFWWYFALPAVFCSLTNVLMNLVSVGQLSGRSMSLTTAVATARPQCGSC